MLTIITEDNNVSCFNTIDNIHTNDMGLDIYSAGVRHHYEFAYLHGRKILGTNTIEDIKVNGKSLMPKQVLYKLSDCDNEYSEYCVEVMYMPVTIMEAVAAEPTRKIK